MEAPLAAFEFLFPEGLKNGNFRRENRNSFCPSLSLLGGPPDMMSTSEGGEGGHGKVDVVRDVA